jgi:hypothetical protein
MKYTADLENNGDEYVASCSELGVSGHGLSATSALESLRAEIRYRVELCPCSSVEEDWVELDVRG